MDEIEVQLAPLVPAAQRGDRAALQKLVELIHPFVVRYCRARIGTVQHVTADDVAQEVSLAVATSVGRYVDRGKPFMAFVYGIASHKVADAHRARGRDRTNPVDEIPESVDQGVTPEERTLEIDGSNRMLRLLDELSDKAREIVVLRVLVGLSADETAEIVGSNAGAVRVAQHRALEKLRKKLAEG